MCIEQLFWISFSSIMFGLTLVFNYLSIGGVFNDKNQSELSKKYSLPITPPGWAFSIWGIIYLWQGLWLFYILFYCIKYYYTLKSKNALILNRMFYISWIFSCIFNSGWIVLFSFEQIALSSIVLILISISLYFSIYASHKCAHIQFKNPTIFSSNIAVALYRILILNGITFYGTWCSIAQCLNIGIVIAYDFKTDVFEASYGSLTILTTIILIYYFLDFYYVKFYLIHTYSSYLVLLWAIYAVSTNKELNKTLEIWIYSLFGVVIFAFAVKIISGVYYACFAAKKEDNDNPQHMVVESIDVLV